MAKNNRQAINLIAWQAKNRKPTDPQFSTRAILKPEIAQYIAEVTKDGGNPELFLTLWINKQHADRGFGSGSSA